MEAMSRKDLTGDVPLLEQPDLIVVVFVTAAHTRRRGGIALCSNKRNSQTDGQPDRLHAVGKVWRSAPRPMTCRGRSGTQLVER
jgi:hypothetical protein